MENYNKNVLIPGTLYARLIPPTGDVNYETFSSSARCSAVKKTKAPIRRKFHFSALTWVTDLIARLCVDACNKKH